MLHRKGNRPAGSWVVMTTTIAGVDLYVMAYAWSQKGIAYMVSSCGTTVTHESAYISKFEDEFGNVSSKELPRPAIAHMIYDFLPLIDEHNKARQNGLSLETVWRTQNCWIRVMITMLGMAVVDLMRWDRAMRVRHVEDISHLAVEYFDDDGDEDNTIVVQDYDVKSIADMIGRPLKDGTFKYREGPQPTTRMTTQVSFGLLSINLQMRSHTKTL